MKITPNIHPVAEFRAWDIRSSKMVNDALILTENQQLYSVNADFNSLFSFFDGCKWMQFIGIKDKNNIKIFVGDILKGDNSVLYKVIFSNGSYCGQVLGNLATDYPNPYNLGDFDMEGIKIIGNIYENSELLDE